MRMTERYMHLRIEAQSKALESAFALWKKSEGYNLTRCFCWWAVQGSNL